MITFHEDMAAPMISTLSLHDALPILGDRNGPDRQPRTCRAGARAHSQRDRGAQRESGGKPPHPLWRQRQGGERGRAFRPAEHRWRPRGRRLAGGGGIYRYLFRREQGIVSALADRRNATNLFESS